MASLPTRHELVVIISENTQIDLVPIIKIQLSFFSFALVVKQDSWHEVPLIVRSTIFSFFL